MKYLLTNTSVQLSKNRQSPLKFQTELARGWFIPREKPLEFDPMIGLSIMKPRTPRLGSEQRAASMS